MDTSRLFHFMCAVTMETCFADADVNAQTLSPPGTSLCCNDNLRRQPCPPFLTSLSPLTTTTGESDSDCDHCTKRRRLWFFFFFLFFFGPSFFLLDLLFWIDPVTGFLRKAFEVIWGVCCTRFHLRRSTIQLCDFRVGVFFVLFFLPLLLFCSLSVMCVSLCGHR